VHDRSDGRMSSAQLSTDLAGFLEHLPLLVWVSDTAGNLCWVNATYCAFVGLDGEEALADRWRALVHPHDVDSFACRFLDARARQTDLHAEIRVRHADGSWRWIELWAQPRMDADGTFLGHLGTSADVTDRKRTEDALRTATEQAMGATLEPRLLDGVERARELASSLSRAEHDERRRLGQVLHDDLQQVLFSLQLKLGAAREMLVDGGDVLDRRLGEVEQRLEQAIEITRSLTIDLSPPLLNNDDLETALQWLVSHMAELHHLVVTVEFEQPVDVDDDLRVMLFHIARELLFNVAKHAGTGEATVHVGRTDRDLVLAVRDDGVGFDSDRLNGSGGVGLAHVRERLQLLTGGLDIASAPGAGCTVTVWVPLRENDRFDER